MNEHIKRIICEATQAGQERLKPIQVYDIIMIVADGPSPPTCPAHGTMCYGAFAIAARQLGEDTNTQIPAQRGGKSSLHKPAINGGS